jgi:hypothetical protein
VEPKIAVKTEQNEEPIQVVINPQQEKAKHTASKAKKKNNKRRDPVVEATKDATLGKTITEDSLKENRPARFIEVTSADTDEPKTEPQEVVIEKKPIDSNEISRERNPQMQKLRNKTTKHSKRKKRVAIIGAFMTFFSLIGMIASVWGIVTISQRVINNTVQKQELAKAIFPFVIIDIPEFDDPSTLDNSAIVSSAIWEFIIEADKSKYEKDDLGFTYVPAIDIEPYIRRLFGNDIKIQHQTVDDTSVQMNYDEETKVYTIESTPKFLPYRPRVDKITKSGDILTLKVSYIMPDAMWELDVKDKEEVVGKTMEYKVKKNKNGYQLLSVKLLSVEGIPSSGTNQDQIPEEEQEEESPPAEQENQTSSEAKSASTQQ